MSIEPGTKLGPYEVNEPLGKGGMGEVYRARDTRLDRTVAIKVLPEHLASDPSRRERFEREAKAVSALNHPHICTLHDVGEQDGMHYLVMELVEGQTLEQRLETGRLPMDQALEYAIQIADALDKAHRKGIVHRDLKPANIMLTNGGVKLLDFGLAKLKGDESPVTTLSQMPTQDASKPLTQEGTIIGTLQYMAPEQLESKDADARTDIFAFGAVVYEMVTGKKAFDGKTQASLIAAIMEREPQPMTSLEPLTPGALNRLVQRCLLKDPEERWQTVRDLHAELKWVSQTGTSETDDHAEKTTTNVAGTVARRPLSWRSVLLIGWLATLFFIAVTSVVTIMNPDFTANLGALVPDGPTGRGAEMRVDIDTPTTSDPVSFAVSPDGQRLVFVASGSGVSQLWLRSLETDEAERLTGTEGASFPFWSPDGNSIGFFADAQLKRIDLDTALVRALAPATTARGGTWGTDELILYTPIAGGTINQIRAVGGEPTVAVTDPVSNNRFPVFLPDGRRFLFFNSGNQAIYLGTVGVPEAKMLAEANSTALFHPLGYLLFVREGALLAQRFNEEDGALVGDPSTVSDNVFFGADGESAVSVSSAAAIAYRRGSTGTAQLSWFNRSGADIGTVGGDNSGFVEPRISPDGRRVAAVRDGDIWIIDAETGSASQFTFDPSPENSQIWSHDGAYIFYRYAPGGSGGEIHRKLSSGLGSPEVLVSVPSGTSPGNASFPLSASPDGSLVLYVYVPLPNVDIRILPLDGDRESRPYLTNPDYAERRGQLSPDGRWVAYESNESGRTEVYIRPFPNAAEGQWRVSTNSGIFPRWSRDGREIYYIGPGGVMMAVPIEAGNESFQFGTAIELFQTRISSSLLSGVAWPYDVSPDGDFLMTVPSQQDTNPITLVLNWNPENTQ